MRRRSSSRSSSGTSTRKGRTAGWVSIGCTPPVERLGVISPAVLHNEVKCEVLEGLAQLWRTPLRRSSEKPPVQTAHYRRRGIPISASIIRSPIWGSGHTRPWGIGVGRSEGLEPPDWVPSREGGRGGIAPLLDRALLDLGYLVGHKTVRLAVHGLGRLLVRGVRQAEDLTRLFVEPVL